MPKPEAHEIGRWSLSVCEQLRHPDDLVRLRGITKAASEWTLVTLAYNRRRLASLQAA